MLIREYKSSDNLEWVRCRVLSFLDSSFYDNVLREKEYYDNPSLELVAKIDNKIIGLLDIEYENEKGTVCYNPDHLGGVIWHLAVLPEYRRRGVSTALLNVAVEKLRRKKIKKIEAWTRDDKWVNDWYVNRGFNLKEQYLHVFMEGKECNSLLKTKIDKLKVNSCFAHYVGDNKEEIMRSFNRVHECNLYELFI